VGEWEEVERGGGLRRKRGVREEKMRVVETREEEERKIGMWNREKMEGRMKMENLTGVVEEQTEEIEFNWGPLDISTRLGGTLRIGGRLLDYVKRWEETCGGGWLLRSGFRIFWESRRWKNFIDLWGPKRKECWQKGIEREAMRESVEEGLRTGVIVEVRQEEVKLASASYVVPKAKGGFRQVLDLRLLNCGTKKITFQMEDTIMLMELARKGDFATSLDIKSAFNHIPTDPSALYYLSFFFEGKAYAWRGMPFGARHAPLIFTKVMSVVLKYIRRRWSVRCVGYMDDLLFLHENESVLRTVTMEIAAYMGWLGWILSMEKCEMEPKQEITFLGWIWNFQTLTLRMKKERREEMRQLLHRWIGICEAKEIVKCKHLAALLGKINFLRWQFPRVALYTTTMNRTKVRGVKREGWNGSLRMCYAERRELTVIHRWVTGNTPRYFQAGPPEATLTTDASHWGWGAVLERKELRLYYHGEFEGRWKDLTSSNQRETAAVMLALSATVRVLREWRVGVLCVESDNSTTVSNLVRVRAAKSMVGLVRRIFKLLVKEKIEIIAKHRPGVVNEKADALSRLERAGDYALKEEIFWKGLMGVMKEKENVMEIVEVDLFATNWNTKLQRYIAPSADALAEGLDAFSMPWQGLRAYVHPPIAMVAKALRKIEQEKVEAVVVTPDWPSQPWWPVLDQLIRKRVVLGESEEVLTTGQSMRERMTKLPPGQMIMSRIFWQE
jgi:hypothetical protein